MYMYVLLRTCSLSRVRTSSTLATLQFYSPDCRPSYVVRSYCSARCLHVRVPVHVRTSTYTRERYARVERIPLPLVEAHVLLRTLKRE